MLQQLPLIHCGIAITAKALQKSFCHEMVVVQHRQGRGVVLRDAHVQDAVLGIQVPVAQTLSLLLVVLLSRM